MFGISVSATMHFMLRALLAFIALAATHMAKADTPKPPAYPVAASSSAREKSSPAGAIDGDRFSCEPHASWQGRGGEKEWWWQVEFPAERKLGAILQINGNHPLCLANGPKRYVWQISGDGKTWQDLDETAVADERRTFRLHRLKTSRTALFARLLIREALGDFPTLREVEFFDDPRAEVAFPPWAIVVSTTGSDKVPGAGIGFIPLARSCKG